MHMQVKELLVEERQFLHKIILSTKDHIQFRRAVIILYSELGMNTRDITRLVSTDEDCVYGVIKSFNDIGMAYVDYDNAALPPGQFTFPEDSMIPDCASIIIAAVKKIPFMQKYGLAHTRKAPRDMLTEAEFQPFLMKRWVWLPGILDMRQLLYPLMWNV